MDNINFMCFMPVILVVVWAMGLRWLGRAMATKPQDTTYESLPLTDTRVYYIPPSGVKSYPTVEITQRRQE